MLKQEENGFNIRDYSPAAFGRLCVETNVEMNLKKTNKPAAFGRLCVETLYNANGKSARLPAAFGRLCVETSHRSS